MNPRTTEDRLKAALSARAELVTQDTLRPGLPPVPQRRPPLRLLTFALPLTVAAAAAAVVITGTLVRPQVNHTISPASTSPIVTPTSPATQAAGQAATARDDYRPPAATGGTGGAATPDPVSIDLTAYPHLVPGDRGQGVKVLQTVLSTLHYDAGPVDGYFGPRTADAVNRFRTLHHLPRDDRFDGYDWAALLSAGPDRPRLERGSTGEAVRRVQRALTAALGRTVVIDGSFGPQTEQAVRDFQRTMNVEPTGVVDELTWKHLGGRPPEPPSSPSPSPTPSPSTPPTPTAPPTTPLEPGAGLVAPPS